MAANRISFNENDAVHIYEWLIMYWNPIKDGELKDCPMCSNLEQRLSKFIGPAMTRAVKKSVKEHPNC